MNGNRVLHSLIIGSVLLSFALCLSVAGEDQGSVTIASATQPEESKAEAKSGDRIRPDKGTMDRSRGMGGMFRGSGGPGGPPGSRSGGRERGPSFGRGMSRWFESSDKMESFRREHPDLVKAIEESKRINDRIIEIVEAYHKNKEKDDSSLNKKAVENELKTLLDRATTLETKRQKIQIEIIEKRLKLMKKMFEQRVAKRDSEVKRLIEFMLDNPPPPDGKSWHPFRRGRPPEGRSERRRDEPSRRER